MGDLEMSLFLLWGPPFMTGDGPKITHFGLKMFKYGRLVSLPKQFKRNQNNQMLLVDWYPIGQILAE